MTDNDDTKHIVETAGFIFGKFLKHMLETEDKDRKESFKELSKKEDLR